MFRALTATAALALCALLASAPAIAAPPCRDAKGHFIKCPPPPPPKPVRCKNAQGKFAVCGTPGAVPIKPTTVGSATGGAGAGKITTPSHPTPTTPH